MDRNDDRGTVANIMFDKRIRPMHIGNVQLGQNEVQSGAPDRRQVARLRL
jgi:hypothetical protein